MRVMPICPTKEAIQGRIVEHCNYYNIKRIFSLIGIDAGVCSQLVDVEVVSAETQKEVFYAQRNLYPEYTLYNTGADYALAAEKPFDVIWLDFFGNCMDPFNYRSVVIASRRLNVGGKLFITSNKRSPLGKQDPTILFEVLGLTVQEQFEYRNNGCNMVFYITHLK